MFTNVYCLSLAVFFVAAGARKLMRPKETQAATNAGAWANDFSPTVIKGIGAVEVVAAFTLAAACLIDKPALAVLACSILCMVMIGAVITHVKRAEYKQSAFAGAVGIALIGGIANTADRRAIDASHSVNAMAGAGSVHVAAACIAMAVGMAVLVSRKGDSRHAGLGRLYVGAMLFVNLSVLGVYQSTGQPGPFHVLAAISIVTTGLGWLSARGHGRRDRAVEAHASFMTWSWIGVVTAGLAQFANLQWPEQSPWPVLSVVGLATATGAVYVPRFVSRQVRRQQGWLCPRIIRSCSGSPWRKSFSDAGGRARPWLSTRPTHRPSKGTPGTPS